MITLSLLAFLRDVTDFPTAPANMLVWQTIIGVTMVAACYLILQFKSKECRDDKIAMALAYDKQTTAMAAQYTEQTKAYVLQVSEALKQNALLVQVAVTLSQEIQHERERERERRDDR